MNSIMKQGLLGLILVSLVACGKTPEEQALEDATNKTQQHRELRLSIENEGTPTADWSNTRLDEYENKLDRLEKLEEEIRANNGKNGVIVKGANNSVTIAKLKALASLARSVKALNHVGESASPSVRIDHNDGASFHQRLTQINTISEGPYAELKNAPSPDFSSSRADIDAYLRLCDRADEALDQQETELSLLEKSRNISVGSNESRSISNYRAIVRDKKLMVESDRKLAKLFQKYKN